MGGVRLVPGAMRFADLTSLSEKLGHAAVTTTGEGRYDETSLTETRRISTPSMCRYHNPLGRHRQTIRGVAAGHRGGLADLPVLPRTR